jgi:hypothetical protein
VVACTTTPVTSVALTTAGAGSRACSSSAAGGRYTELFFLDEATALAAGHRPCAECRRADYRHLVAVLAERDPGRRGADAIDAQLHDERLVAGTGERRLHEGAFDELPDGAFVLHNGKPRLVLGDALLTWSPAGYVARTARPAGRPAVVITPPSLIALLRTRRTPLVPLVHPTARRG